MKPIHAEIPLSIKVRGDVELSVRNVATGKVTHHRQFKNALMNVGYFDRLLAEQGPNLVSWGTSDGLIGQNPECRIGTGTTAVAATQTALASQVATAARVVGQEQRSDEFDNPVWKSQLFTFAVGAYVGTIKEVALFARQRAGQTTLRMMARQLLAPEITLGSLDQLSVRWKISADFGTQISSGTIVNGQRTGGDVDWRLTINDRQMMTHCVRANTYNVAGASTDNVYNRLWSATVFPFAKLGDSNSESDLRNDGQYTIKGNELFASSVAVGLKTSTAYSTGALNRSVTIGFEHNAPNNVEVGEMVLGSFGTEDETQSYGGLFRVTFDPKLDKATANRLFITFNIKLEQN